MSVSVATFDTRGRYSAVTTQTAEQSGSGSKRRYSVDDLDSGGFDVYRTIKFIPILEKYEQWETIKRLKAEALKDPTTDAQLHLLNKLGKVLFSERGQGGPSKSLFEWSDQIFNRVMKEAFNGDMREVSAPLMRNAILDCKTKLYLSYVNKCIEKGLSQQGFEGCQKALQSSYISTITCQGLLSKLFSLALKLGEKQIQLLKPYVGQARNLTGLDQEANQNTLELITSLFKYFSWKNNYEEAFDMFERALVNLVIIRRM